MTVTNLALAAYPVGSIYMSVNSTSPQDIFGGTWERLKDRFLLGAGDTYSNGATGGEAAHTLQASEIPAHTHGQRAPTGSFNLRGGNNYDQTTSSDGIVSRTFVAWGGTHVSASNGNTNPSGYTTIKVTATHEHDSVGGGGSHNNMPPYLAVYMWKRTA